MGGTPHPWEEKVLSALKTATARARLSRRVARWATLAAGATRRAVGLRRVAVLLGLIENKQRVQRRVLGHLWRQAAEVRQGR